MRMVLKIMINPAIGRAESRSGRLARAHADSLGSRGIPRFVAAISRSLSSRPHALRPTPPCPSPCPGRSRRGQSTSREAGRSSAQSVREGRRHRRRRRIERHRHACAANGSPSSKTATVRVPARTARRRRPRHGLTRYPIWQSGMGPCRPAADVGYRRSPTLPGPGGVGVSAYDLRHQHRACRGSCERSAR
jgi:hypothetical protein